MTPWAVAHRAPLPFTSSQSLLKLMSIESVMLSNYLILRHCLLLLPSVFTSIRVFPNESALYIRWPKYFSFSFSISSSNKYSGLISCGDDWFYLLGVQGTLKCLLQLHNSKATILQHSSVFTVQLSHAYMTTGEIKALTAAAAAVTSVVSDSVRPHRQQPTRLPCLWDSPGKNTGMGCHFLLQCIKVKGESEVSD